jgi:hypothetical protein
MMTALYKTNMLNFILIVLAYLTNSPRVDMLVHLAGLFLVWFKSLIYPLLSLNCSFFVEPHQWCNGKRVCWCVWRQSYRIISWNILANRICLVTLINYHPY